ncbi:MAG: sulfatase-like hydrolase/transferase, partial [Planctomycetota bacterium]
MNETRRPSNIIWFFADQHRGQAQSWMGDPNLSTPEFDRMAAEGVAFPRAVAPCPWCTPFRGSLLTSRHAHQAVQRTPQRLDPELPTVAQVFNQAGYHSAYFGKWHLDGSNRTHQIPRERRGGFQDWWAYENRNAPWDNCFHYDNANGVIEDEQVDQYECDAIVDRLIGYIRQRAEDRQPFFAVASSERPHDPYVA